MREINFAICKPLNGISDNWWIGLDNGFNTIVPIAYIHASKAGKKRFKKELNLVLNKLWEMR